MQGKARCGRRGMSRCGPVLWGLARHGLAGLVRPGWACLGRVWYGRRGLSRLGGVMWGVVWRVEARQARQRVASRVKASCGRNGTFGWVESGPGTVWQAWYVMVWFGLLRKGKVRQASQGMARRVRSRYGRLGELWSVAVRPGRSRLGRCGELGPVKAGIG